MLSK
ncbi:hypothetical protein D041_0649A, partial [Vibrio parahaemolyticus EKP-008]|jgi:hypothetical protein